MTATSPTAIVDAAITDLLTNTTLGNPTVWKYVEPVVIMASSCPFLAAWCTQTRFEILTGAKNLEAFERHHTLGLAWYVYGQGMADTGGSGDPATVDQLDEVAETIIARAATWASGIPGLEADLVATLIERRLQAFEGSIWRAYIELDVIEAA